MTKAPDKVTNTENKMKTSKQKLILNIKKYYNGIELILKRRHLVHKSKNKTYPVLFSSIPFQQMTAHNAIK